MALELLINLYVTFLHSEKREEAKHLQKIKDFDKIKLNIIYHPRYNITAFGIEKCHPFDSCKYGRIVQKLKDAGLIKSEKDMHKPSMITRATLLKVKLKKKK